MNFLSVSGSLIGKAMSWARRTSALYLDTEAPTIPQNLAEYSVTDGTITLIFDAATDNFAVKEYRLYEYADSTYTRVTSGVSWNGLEVTISGLSPGTSKVYAVTAVDFGNNVSGYSDTVSTGTSEDTDTTDPTNSIFICDNPDDGSLVGNISQGGWVYSDDVGVVGWIVHVVANGAGNPWGTKPDDQSPSYGTWVTTQPNTYTALGLDQDNDVYCAVKDAAGNVSAVLYDTITTVSGSPYYPFYAVDQSTYFAFTPLVIGAGASPLTPATGLELIIVSTSEILAKWDPLTLPMEGATFIELQWKEGAGSYATKSSTIPLTDTSYPITGCTASTLQYVQVRTNGSPANSDWSVAATGTTNDVSLPAPTINSISSPAYNRLVLNITVPQEVGDTEYYKAYNYAYGSEDFIDNVAIPTSGLTADIQLDASPSTNYTIGLRAYGLSQLGDTSGYSYYPPNGYITTDAAPVGSYYYQDKFDNGQKNNSSVFTWLPASKVIVSSDESYSGAYSLAFPHPAGACGSGCVNVEQRFKFAPNEASALTEAWFEWRWFLPGNFQKYANDHSSDKFFAVWAGSDTISDTYEVVGYSKIVLEYANYTPTWDSYSARLRVLCKTECDTCPQCSTNSAYYPNGHTLFRQTDLGLWHRMRVYVKAGLNGHCTVWFDNTMVFDADRNMSSYQGHDQWMCGFLGGWVNEGFYDYTVFYYDDFTIYNSDPGW